MKRYILLALMLFILPAVSLAQESIQSMAPASQPNAANGNNAAAMTNDSLAKAAQAKTEWSRELVQFLSLAVLLFTFGALMLSTLLLWRDKAHGEHILRVFGIILIIGISALLLVVGYSDAQLTPIVGLFGAIAGYLLGKDSKNNPAPVPIEVKNETQG